MDPTQVAFRNGKSVCHLILGGPAGNPLFARVDPIRIAVLRPRPPRRARARARAYVHVRGIGKAGPVTLNTAHSPSCFRYP